MSSFIEHFVTRLGYVLADGAAPFLLESRLRFVAGMRAAYGMSEVCWDTVQCARDSDPLDYAEALPYSGGVATAADVATLWREYLHQGLHVVTRGSAGRPHGRQALRAFAAVPRLVSQVELTVGPRPAELAADLRILLPLWEIPADRVDADLDATRLVLTVSSPRLAAERLLRSAGLSPALIDATLDDPRRVRWAVEPPPAGTRYGVRPGGALFSVTDGVETDLVDSGSGRPYGWQQLQTAATRAGWVD